MGAPSGLSAQLGVVDEVTYGTPVVVSRFYEFRDESMKYGIDRIESKALRAGTNTIRSDRWAAGLKTVEGDVTLELATKSFGFWLKHMFGTIATTQPSVGTDPTVYDHTATPIVGSLTGKSFTLQAGRPDTGATVRPYTYQGCKITEWSLEATVGEFGILKPKLFAQDEVTATGLATASYPSSLIPLTFVGASLSLAGSAASVKSVTLTGNNGLKTDRPKLGSQTELEPMEAAMRQFTGKVDAEYVDLTQYNRFVNANEIALVLLFQGPIISNAFRFQLQITCNVRFDGDTPNASGPDEIRQPLTFKCVDTGSGPASAITAVYRTTDTTP